jgi:hypothetical protein
VTLLRKPALTLSQLSIDTDKGWEEKAITELKELAAGMATGDMLYFDGTRLVKITPGPVGTDLMTHDVGNPPSWEYPP